MKRLIAAVLMLGLAGGVYAKDKKDKKLGHMKEKLELTDDQAAKLEKSMTAAREATKPARRQLRDLTAKLADQLEDKAGESALKATLDSIEKVHKDLKAQREKAHDEMKSILTVTQRAKMIVGMKHAMMGRGMHGKKGMGRGARGAGPDKDVPADEEEGAEEDDD